MADELARQAVETAATGGAGITVGATLAWVVRRLVEKWKPSAPRWASALRDDVGELRQVVVQGIAELKAEQRVLAAAQEEQKEAHGNLRERVEKGLGDHRERLDRDREDITYLKALLEYRLGIRVGRPPEGEGNGDG